MVFADFMLHLRVDRWNTDAGIKNAGNTNFGLKGDKAKGVKGVHIYDDDVLEDLYVVREAGKAMGMRFKADTVDEWTSPTTDTMERFGIGWAQTSYFDVFDEGCNSQKVKEMEKHFEFTKAAEGETVTRLDIEVLATIYQGDQLCEEQQRALGLLQDQLDALDRDGVQMDELARHVCAVLQAKPPDAADDGPAGGVADGAAADIDAAAATSAAVVVVVAVAGSVVVAGADAGDGSAAAAATAAASGLAGSDAQTDPRAERRIVREKEKAEEEAAEKLKEAVVATLWRVLRGKKNGAEARSKNVADNWRVTRQQLDAAFVEYAQLMARHPAALDREYKTGQSVLNALNGLHDIDELKIASGIQTRKGLDLYLEILRGLSDNNTHKATDRQVAVEWNRRVSAMCEAATGDKARAQIRLEYGFVSEKNVKKHTDRLGVRVQQVSMSGSIGVQLKELASHVKQKQANVEVMPATAPSWSSMQSGSAGPAAQVYETSALQPPAPATAAATPAALTKEQTSNVCYKCFMLGDRPAPQCYLRIAKVLTPGHTGREEGREVDCELFDAAYPLEHADRVAKIEAARKAKRKAIRWFADQKKKNHANNAS